jgi:ABC-type transporter Mla subunit MlaD
LDERLERLEKIIEQIGEAVIATTETVDRFAERVDMLADQVQQQGYQIFALSDAIQTLAENQESAMMRLDTLTDTLQRLVVVIEQSDEIESESNSED